jgi:hypothetical protein
MVDRHAVELRKRFSQHQTMQALKRSSTGCFADMEARGDIKLPESPVRNQQFNPHLPHKRFISTPKEEQEASKYQKLNE